MELINAHLVGLCLSQTLNPPYPIPQYSIPISIAIRVPVTIHTPSLDPSMMAMMKLRRGLDDQRLFFFSYSVVGGYEGGLSSKDN